jgi:hypothetical protein
MFVGGLGDGIAGIFLLAGLGMVFIAGSLIAVVLKVIGINTGRAVLWGFGLPLTGLLVLLATGWMASREGPEEAISEGIPIEIEQVVPTDRQTEGA